MAFHNSFIFCHIHKYGFFQLCQHCISRASWNREDEIQKSDTVMTNLAEDRKKLFTFTLKSQNRHFFKPELRYGRFIKQSVPKALTKFQILDPHLNLS